MVLLYLACLYATLCYLFGCYLLVRLIGRGRARVLLMHLIWPSTAPSANDNKSAGVGQIDHAADHRTVV